ncbi:MAG: hypothetical protein ABEJ02_03225 [Candidatus Paceibacteria bacterium]
MKSLLKVLLYLFPSVSVYVLNLFLTKYGYYQLDWLSSTMHLVGGFVLAWSLYLFYSWGRKSGVLSDLKTFELIFMLVGVVAIAGILWEVYEILLDIHLDTNFIPGAKDTIEDLIMDLVGALVFSLYLFIPHQD